MAENITVKTLTSSERIEMLRTGVSNAVKGLSQMVGQDIKIANINLNKVQVKDIPELFGGPQEMMVAVYLAICGNTNGHMIAIYQPQTAFDLIDMLLGQPAGTTKELSEMERSVLGEVGNIMGSFFLNHLSNTTGNSLQPSPPASARRLPGMSPMRRLSPRRKRGTGRAHSPSSGRRWPRKKPRNSRRRRTGSGL